MCEVRNSTIKGAGKGLFAMRDFKEGEIVTVYGGSYFINDQSPYLLTDDYGIIWDGSHDFSETELGRWANDADYKTNFENNTFFETIYGLGRPPVLVASRDIKNGEEIFVSYGPRYWKYFGEIIKGGSTST